MLALIVAIGMAMFFWGLWQVMPQRLRVLLGVCGRPAIANPLILFVIYLGAAPPWAHAFSTVVGVTGLSLMFTLHVLGRARLQATLLLPTILLGMIGYSEVAGIVKVLWLVALGVMLLSKTRQCDEARVQMGEAIRR